MGFQSALELTVDEATIGKLGWGGKSQRGSVYTSVMGTGCQLASDLPSLFRVIEQHEWALRRTDIALDVADGSVTIQSAREAYDRGGFSGNGRPPEMDMIGPVDGSDRGRTLTVGNREADKFLRVYEKGLKELRSAIAEWGPEALHARMQLDGEWIDPALWVRVEVELKAKKRPIPYDVCDRRDEYFAGSYPYLSEILPNAAPQLILSPDRRAMVDVDLVLAQIRRQYGSHLFTALTVYQGDMGAVWERVCGDRLNEGMVRAGALLARA
jgi:DNA relaxase NicK